MLCSLYLTPGNVNKLFHIILLFLIIAVTTLIDIPWFSREPIYNLTHTILNGLQLFEIMILINIFRILSCSSVNTDCVKNRLDGNVPLLTTADRKKYFQLRFLEEIERSKRAELCSCILKIRIFDFDKLIYTYGETTSQSIIDEVDKVLELSKRAYDPSYFDGKDFILLCTQTRTDDIIDICNRLLKKIYKYPVISRVNDNSIMPNSINIPLVIGAIEYKKMIDKPLDSIILKLDDILNGLEANTYNIVKHN